MQVTVDEALYIKERQIALKMSIWHNSGQTPFSHWAYFCPTCGEVWGRRIHIKLPQLKFRVVERSCEAHGDGSLVFSEHEWSMLLQAPTSPEDARALEAFYPLTWLAYELFLIVRRYP